MKQVNLFIKRIFDFLKQNKRIDAFLLKKSQIKANS